MYVRNSMTANPYVIAPDASIADSLALMKSKKIKRLPVVKNGRMVGLITHNQLMEVSPSPPSLLTSMRSTISYRRPQWTPL